MGIRWKLDGDVTEEHRKRALNKLAMLKRYRESFKMRFLRKVMYDAECRYEFYITDSVNRIRIESFGAVLRFWVYADGATHGLYKSGGAWLKKTLPDIRLLPPAFTYSWGSADGKYLTTYRPAEDLNRDTAFRHFLSFPTGLNSAYGHYARVGAMNGDAWGGGCQPVVLDAPGAAERETLYNPPLATVFDPDQFPPFMDATFDYDGEGYIRPRFQNGTINGAETSLVVKGLVETVDGLITSVAFSRGGGIVNPYAPSEKVYPTVLATSDVLALAPPYDSTAVRVYAMTRPAGLEIYHFYYNDTVRADNEQLVAHGTRAVSALAGSTPSQFYSGPNVLVDIDHGAQTAVFTELDPVYSNRYLVTTLTVGDVLTADITDTNVFTGYGYDSASALKKLSIHIAESTEYETTGSVASGAWELARPNGYTLDLKVDGVAFISHAKGVSAGTWKVSRDEFGAYTTEYSGKKSTPVVVINDWDIRSDSFSIIILEAVTDYSDITVDDTFGTVLIYAGAASVVYTYTEYTRVAGVDETPTVYSTTVAGPFGAPQLIETYPVAAPVPSDEDTTTEEITLSPNFPENISISAKNTGFLANFVRDREGSTLAYCPVGQEAYWRTGEDAASSPAEKWLISRPTVFKLYDAGGNAVDLSSFGFTDVETIAPCDGFQV